MEYIRDAYPVRSKPSGVMIVPDLQDVTSYILRMGGEKIFDIIPVDWQTPVRPEMSA